MKVTASEGFSFITLSLFFLLLILNVVRKFKTLFLQTHGRLHRLTGLFHLLWLVLGLLMVPFLSQKQSQLTSKNHQFLILLYDIILGLFGNATTISAAHNFPHKYIHNKTGQSGTLATKAIVTQGEMVEHSFYQLLNLLQAIFLHAINIFPPSTISSSPSPYSSLLKLAALFGVTFPWSLRHLFPVHSFSANWEHKAINQQRPVELLLYKVKKYQYLFYKHVLFHGLNIIVLFPPNPTINVNLDLPLTTRWRLYWTALNTSYVMEFFLQSLVKRNLLSQQYMILLQRLLISASSVAAVDILITSNDRSLFPAFYLAIISMTSIKLNFQNRGHDLANTMCLGLIVAFMHSTVFLKT